MKGMFLIKKLLWNWLHNIFFLWERILRYSKLCVQYLVLNCKSRHIVWTNNPKIVNLLNLSSTFRDHSVEKQKSISLKNYSVNSIFNQWFIRKKMLISRNFLVPIIRIFHTVAIIHLLRLSNLYPYIVFPLVFVRRWSLEDSKYVLLHVLRN